MRQFIEITFPNSNGAKLVAIDSINEVVKKENGMAQIKFKVAGYMADTAIPYDELKKLLMGN